jgi:hypothetical protein
MKHQRIALTFLIAVLGTTAFAEDALLLPITPSSIHGAFGTRWQTVLFAWNGSQDAAVLDCPPEACRNVPAQTQAMFQASGGGNAAFVRLPDGSAHVQLALRTFLTTADGSRTAFELPVVSRSRFRADAIRILGVPIGNGYRQSLRIYDADGRDGAQVRLQIYTAMTDPIVDGIVTLHVNSNQAADGTVRPAYAEIHNLLATWPMLEQDEIATIVITSLDRQTRIWAFATSTHNETQQINNFVP